MSRLSTRYPRTAPGAGPISTVAPTRTHEGGTGFVLDAKGQLFTLAVSRFGGEDAYYEVGTVGDARFVDLVQAVAQDDPAWLQAFLPWLRNEANMRTYAVQAAVEYAHSGAPNGRQVLTATLARADEPGEALAYALGRYGRRLKMAVKRGIADAATKLYNQRAYVKWDSDTAPYRWGDVIELTHPTPKALWQSMLFRRAIDDRHKRTELTPVPEIDAYRAWIKAGAPLDALPEVATWENLSAHHKMDAAAWEAVIPQMGYMALLRNLRNFEQAKISKPAQRQVIDVLTDPEQVAKSRQLPFRFWSAYRESGGLTYVAAVEEALGLAVQNVPTLSGRTLIMIDVSGSMSSPMSGKSKLAMKEAAALFGAAVAAKTPGVLVAYATAGMEFAPQPSVLRTIDDVMRQNGVMGHGTNTWPVCQQAWIERGPFDRVMIFTDLQAHPSQGDSFIPRHVPVYSWDLRGYGVSHNDLTPGTGRYQLGGLSDHTFKLIPMLERGASAGWPWEIDS